MCHLNKSVLISKFIVFLILLLTSSVQAQRSITDGATISLFSCDSGDALYSTFGHTAIRVKDPVQNIDLVFHYGLFNFNDPNFYTKFLRGKLMYSMGAQSIKSFYRQYEQQQRTVYEQVLNLGPEEKQRLYTMLMENYEPENREYLYDFFFNNCSTIVRDRFESVFPDLVYPKEIRARTFRDMLDEHLTKMPWTDFGIDLIIGSVADDTTNVRQQLFLPMYMHDIYNNTFRNGEPFVTGDDLVIDFISKKHQEYKSWITPATIFGILVLFELLFLIWVLAFKKHPPRWLRFYDRFLYFLLGVGSLILAFMWWGTDHMATKSNWNLVWMNPIFFILLWTTFKKTSKIYLVILAICLMIMLSVLSNVLLIPQAIHTASYILVFAICVNLVRNIVCYYRQSGAKPIEELT